MVSRKELATLNVAVRMETAQFKRESQKLKQDVKQTSNQMKRGAGAGFFGFNLQSAAIIGGTTAALGIFNRTMKETAAQVKQARILGIDESDWIALNDLAEGAAVNVSDLSQAFRKLQRSIDAALGGSTEAGDVFTDLGLDPETLQTMRPVEQLQAVLDGLRKIEDQAIRMGRATKLLDIGGGQAALKLANDYENLRNAIEATTKITSDQAAAVTELDDSWTTLKQNIRRTSEKEVLLPLAAQANRAIFGSKSAATMGASKKTWWQRVWNWTNPLGMAANLTEAVSNSANANNPLFARGPVNQTYSQFGAARSPTPAFLKTGPLGPNGQPTGGPYDAQTMQMIKELREINGNTQKGAAAQTVPGID